MSLKDKVCIVTGGGSGIGRGVALSLAEDGAKIAVVGRTAAKVEAVQEQISSAGGTAKSWTVDVSDHEAVNRMVAEVHETFGRIDVLVNNAGHSSAHRRLMNSPPEETRSVIDSNLLGTIFCTQAVVPIMLDAKSGTIINVSSLAAVQPGPFSGFAYGAAKAGVVNFTEFINADLRNTGIRASVVIPGEVATPIMEKRPVPPSQEARELMVDVDETSAAIHLIAAMPARTNIPQLVIRPTIHRDVRSEMVPMR